MIMHPLIRMVSFLVFAAGAAYASPGVLAVVTAAIMLAYLLHRQWLPPAWQMLRRLRWLFLSILVIYALLTPGVPLLSLEGGWVPTVAGLRQGGIRILALVLVVLTVNILLRVTGRRELCAAIYQFVTPLSWLGLSRDRLAVRMILVLETLPGIERQLRGLQAALSPARSRWRGTAAVAATAFRRIVDQAEHEPCRTIEFSLLSPPPWYQWLLPPLVAVFMFGLR